MNSDLFITERIIALPDFSPAKPVAVNDDDDYEEIDLIRTSKITKTNTYGTKLMTRITDLDDDSDVEINDVASVYTDLDEQDEYDDVASAYTDLDDDTYETPRNLPNLRAILGR